jgi:GNAT superfamily N-acetyltransferase
MDEAVALFGGSVLPAARGRGVYRALVRARWDHAVARGTPVLVVQAGAMSRPVLTGLGFESHCEIRLMVDRL